MLKNVDKDGLQTSFFHRKVRHLQQYLLGWIPALKCGSTEKTLEAAEHLCWKGKNFEYLIFLREESCERC